MNRRFKLASGIALTALAIAGAACSSPSENMATSTATSAPQAAATSMASASPMALAPNTADTPAAGLRSTLNTVLEEHVYLASGATGAALGGRGPEFEAAAAALDENSVALSKA